MSFHPRLLLLLLVLAAACLAALPSAADAVELPFSKCSWLKRYKVRVLKVRMLPDPAVAGRKAHFFVSAFTKEALLGGDVEFELSGPKTSKAVTKKKLCLSALCPVLPGIFIVNVGQSLSANSLPGTYNLKVRVMDKKGEELTCVQTHFTVTAKGSLAAASNAADDADGEVGGGEDGGLASLTSSA